LFHGKLEHSEGLKQTFDQQKGYKHLFACFHIFGNCRAAATTAHRVGGAVRTFCEQ